MKKKKLENEKEIEMMVNAIRGGISKGEKCISFYMTDGEIRGVFIKMDVERERTEKEKKEDLKEKLKYIG